MQEMSLTDEMNGAIKNTDPLEEERKRRVIKQHWRTEGQEPDYRFSLANERTFLAWIRTALGLLACGVLLEQFSMKLGSHMTVVFLAVIFGSLATILCAFAYFRWRSNEIAMRHARKLPGTLAMPLVSAFALGVSAATVFMLIQRI